MNTAPEEMLYVLFDQCLEELAAGTGLDEVLSRHPAEAAELRPLLEAALWAMLPAEISPPPLSAKIASKNRFLDAAQALEKKRGWGWFPRPMRMAGSVLLVLVVFLTSLTVGGSLVSAQALPGDPLYTVKRAFERVDSWLATSPASQLALEERLDSRRADEVQRLIGQGRQVDVRFAGFLSGSADQWLVAGIPLSTTSDENRRLERLTGTYVEVTGQTRTGIVAADEIQLRLFHVDGTVDQLTGDLWVVDGVEVRLDPATRLRGEPVVGAVVQITAIRVELERLLALSVWVRGNDIPLPVPTVTVGPLLSATGVAPSPVVPRSTATIEEQTIETKKATETELKETSAVKPAETEQSSSSGSSTSIPESSNDNGGSDDNNNDSGGSDDGTKDNDNDD